MPRNNSPLAGAHPDDRMLILAGDGELDANSAAKLRLHLEACWSCRTRQAELQSAVGDYVHLYRNSLDPQLPPGAGSRALFKAHLQLSAAAPIRPRTSARLFAAAFAGLAAITLSLGVANLRAGNLSVPKNALTPGETRAVTLADLCRTGQPREQPAARYFPLTMQPQVFKEYGITTAPPNAYEVDYLITPELGGADSLRNLWPEPYSVVWNAHVKDKLEDRLHDLVCERKLDLAQAQREIATDWIGTYKKYFHTQKPG